MKNNKDLILTFDYELSLGLRSGTVLNCMIKPTKLILELLKEFQFKAIFFVDTTCIMAMMKYSEKYPELLKDIELIKNQVLHIKKEGHYIYHHLHPHWQDAVYIPSEKQWDLSNMKNYSFTYFKEEDINIIFSKSKKILEDWLLPIDSIYQVEGYRAGGLFVQPFSKIKKAFITNGIQYDFSVMFNASCDLSVAKYDYTKHPNKIIYNFNDNVLVENNIGAFTEVAIEMLENKGIYKIINSIWFRIVKQEKYFADGKSIVNNINKTNKKIKFSNKETFSFELINPAKNILYFKEFKNRSIIHFLSHPKHINNSNITYAYKLFKKLSNHYNLNTDFKKIIQNY